MRTFAQEFIEKSKIEREFASKYWTKLPESKKTEEMILQKFAVLLERAKIIRMLSDQSELFLKLPIDENQDFLKWLKPPYDVFYIEPERPFYFDNYFSSIDSGSLAPFRPELRSKYVGHEYVKGILISHGITPKDIPIYGGGNIIIGKDVEDLIITKGTQLFQIHFFIPLKDFFFNTHIASFAITEENKILIAPGEDFAVRTKMVHWAIHTINFLSSPSVKLVRQSPVVTRAMKRRDDPIPPDWYEVTYRKTSRHNTGLKIIEEGPHYHHRFRYDVRGNFATYKRGILEGRVIWRGEHQRGLANAIYKPKVYRIK